MNVGYAHFAFSGAVAVEVTTTETIETFDLSPHRYGIQATAKGNVLSFRLYQGQHLRALQSESVEASRAGRRTCARRRRV
jgi:hypothetical protein